jgi:O-antigen/teichoic acid export membrane protein
MKLSRNIKNIISVFSIELLARFVAFLSVAYLARILGTLNFGIINIGLAVLSYAMIVANGGLTLFGTKKIASETGSAAKLTGDIFLSRILFSLIIFIISAVVVYSFVISKELVEVIIAYLFFLFPSAVMLEWFFQGVQRMDAIVFGKVAGSLVYFLFLLLFVTHKDDTVLTAIGWTIGGIVNSVFLLLIFFRKKFSIKFDFKNFNFNRIVGESLPLGAAAIIAQFVVMFPVIYLGFVSDVSESGIFSAAYKLIILLLALDRVFNALFFPKIVRYISLNPDPVELEKNLNTALKFISFFGLSISLLAVISADYLILVIFGGSFAESSVVFRVLLGNFFLTLLNSVFTYTLIAMNKEKIYTISLLAGTIVFIFTIPVLTAALGSSGPAVSLVMFEFICSVLMCYRLKSSSHINIARNIILPAGFALITSLLIVFSNFPFSYQIFFGAAAIAALGLIAGIGKRELEFIKKVLI